MPFCNPSFLLHLTHQSLNLKISILKNEKEGKKIFFKVVLHGHFILKTVVSTQIQTPYLENGNRIFDLDPPLPADENSLK